MPTLSRPTLLSVAAWDATQEFTFSFTVSTSDAQIVANELVIRNNTTNEIVYNERQETFRYAHVVNANELTNGTYYNATLTTFSADGTESPESIPIQFWCYSTPSLTLTNLPVGNIVTNAAYDFTFTYEQAEGEAINTYVFNLYNSSHTLVSTSGEQYATNGTPPFSGSYTFSGFENSTQYYIQVTAETIEGTDIDTGLISFTVQYSTPDVYTLVQLFNNCNDGYITVTSNFVLIEGTSNPDPPIYIDGHEIDLREEGSWVNWNQGFSINGDVLARIWFRDPNPYSIIADFAGTDGQGYVVRYMEGYQNVDSTEMQSYLTLTVTAADNADIQYYIFSNYVNTLDENSYYTAYITRVGDIYQLQLLTE